ncbi:hypothetical protein [Arthrobacter castelli]|uniref:hypothetical protein n=1 Tax=Arthrobacter castelli TaxID=271431 RepID=UPI000420811C|nr:hypothetical protein [Arthrobacter castelli]
MPTYFPDYEDDPPTVELPAIDVSSPAAPVSEAPRKACGRCRAVTRTHDEFCPQCAARYRSRTPFQRLWRTVALAALIIAGLIAAGAMITAYNSEMSVGTAGQGVQTTSAQTVLMRLSG